MSVDDATKIDGLGIERETGVVVLTIADHLDWSHTKEHLDVLERKINAYLDFITGGQLQETIPDAQGRKAKISVYLQFEPHLDARATLNAVTEKLAAHGIGFWYGCLPEAVE
jgi:hypothetical protein